MKQLGIPDRILLLGLAHIKNGATTEFGKNIQKIIQSESAAGCVKFLSDNKYIEKTEDGTLRLTKQGSIEVYNMAQESSPHRMVDSKLLESTQRHLKTVVQRATDSPTFASKLTTCTPVDNAVKSFYPVSVEVSG